MKKPVIGITGNEKAHPDDDIMMSYAAKGFVEGVSLILQPNNREDDLRIWLQGNGFQIVAESILEEAGKFYEILVVEAGQMKLSASDVRFGPILSKEVSPVFVQKWQKEAAKLELALHQIPEKNMEERQVLVDKIQAIKEVLHASK